MKIVLLKNLKISLNLLDIKTKIDTVIYNTSI